MLFLERTFALTKIKQKSVTMETQRSVNLRENSYVIHKLS